MVLVKLYQLENKRGSYKCGNSRCQVCNNIEKLAFLQVPLQLNSLEDDFEEDFSICLIDKNDPCDPHKIEYYLMRTLKTIAPFELSTEEIYWAVYAIMGFSLVLLVCIITESM